MILVCFTLQNTLFQALAFSNIAPNLMIVLVSSFGFMRGRKEGMWIGLICGLLLDLFYGSVIGFYSLSYLYIGYINGFFRKRFYPEDLKLPLVLIAGSDLTGSLIVYFFLFLMKGNFRFGYYLIHIILPELVYTLLVSVLLYFVILKVNQWLETYEKRSSKNFV